MLPCRGICHDKLPRVITRPAPTEIVIIPKTTSAFKIDPMPGTAFSGEIISMGRAATIEPSRRHSSRIEGLHSIGDMLGE
jgi:hypothetical protein